MGRVTGKPSGHVNAMCRAQARHGCCHPWSAGRPGACFRGHAVCGPALWGLCVARPVVLKKLTAWTVANSNVRPPKLTPHQQGEAIKPRDRGEESLTEIGRSALKAPLILIGIYCGLGGCDFLASALLFITGGVPLPCDPVDLPFLAKVACGRLAFYSTALKL